MSEIIQGDCIQEMKQLPKSSVDAVVTDPPYGLSFMGRSWDQFKPKEFQEFSQRWGKQVFRVLKPGGYLLAFSGTRTYHRMVVGLENAGFEIKDQIDWFYGSGFPKSTDISKQIDKHFDKEDEREIIGENPNNRRNLEGKQPDTMSGKYKYTKLSEPATPQAKKWNGWGTALKPAHEPIVVAQKPREGTYAENVLKHGVGGLNIDGCRIGTEDIKTHGGKQGGNAYGDWEDVIDEYHNGRWPANVILDPSAAAMLDEQSGDLDVAGNVRASKMTGGGNTYSSKDGLGSVNKNPKIVGDEGGGASRFFYCAKAHKSERNAGLEDLEDVNYGQSGGARQALDEGEDEYLQDHIGLNKIKKVKNDIATLKPINLMRYLVRLVTPPEGVVLDPFAGSGTTGCACEIEGFNYILIEKRKRFAKIITPRRCEYWSKPENWTELENHSDLPDLKEKKNQKQHKTLEVFQDA